jgi:hypothetical protein
MAMPETTGVNLAGSQRAVHYVSADLRGRQLVEVATQPARPPLANALRRQSAEGVR